MNGLLHGYFHADDHAINSLATATPIHHSEQQSRLAINSHVGPIYASTLRSWNLRVVVRPE